MSKGLDTMSNCESIASKIKSAGYKFVCRYYNTKNTAKNLTKSEALAFTDAGLYTVAIWENGAPDEDYNWTYEQGLLDAYYAIKYAKKTIYQPEDSTIYFAVDYDAVSSSDLSNITEYFKGVVEQFDGNNNYYSVGVYGSGKVCKLIKSTYSAVTHAWMAGSTGWSGYSTYTGWSIKQTINTTDPVTIGGIEFDTDTSTSSYGAFQIES